MIEITIGIALMVVLWTIRKAFYNQSDVWQEKVELITKDSRADLQEDYKELHDKIEEIKSKNDGKWFQMKDLDEMMK